MDNVKKMARSQSIKMTEFLRLPSRVEVTVEDANADIEEAEDTDQPTTLPILRVAGHEGTKQQRREKEKENKDKTNGVMTAGPGGKICYDDVLHLLTCPMCTCLVSAPVTQCRRGHLFCRDCAKTLSNCSLCHQPWVETPNNTLDKIINLIALPCKYGSQGCSIIMFQTERLKHQTICDFRPVHCQYSSHGCSMVLAVKDMPWHLKQCTFAALKNDLETESDLQPDMPSRKKSTKVKNGKC